MKPLAFRPPRSLILAAVALAGLASCGPSDDVSKDVVTPPERVARFPAELPFEVTRAKEDGVPPTAAEVDVFTRRMVRFFASTEFFRWTRRHSHGLAGDNPWGQPPYLYWWQDIDAVAVRKGDLVTFRHEANSDNMMAHSGRVFGPVAGAYQTLSGPGDQTLLRELALGYIRGVSAMFDGSIWAEEVPVVPTIMARAIFHRNHTWTLDGGRRAAVDYEPVRHEVLERRHDTLHNPANPTWGDIWVRTKRSKDDFPWVYRIQSHLARLLWSGLDRELHDAALKLYDQLQAFAADIVEHGYIIRAKGPDGEVFIPYFEDTGAVDDFASMVEFEEFVPNAECNAKLPVALIATGENLGNDCEDGISETYEDVAMARYYGHTWMQWGFHVSAVATALLHDDPGAQALLTGLGARMDELRVRDDHISADPRFQSDVAQLLVLDAAYGLPLIAVEAQQVMEEYTLAADHYELFELWDLWSDSLADGEYDYYPGRESDAGDGTTRTHIWIPEMPNLFEYCASPVRATGGAAFINCELLTDPAEWQAATR